MIHTNRCKHCGKTKGEHWYEYCDRESMMTEFTDSGLAALDAHKEEFYDAVKKYFEMDSRYIQLKRWKSENKMLKKIFSILNQIEKEKGKRQGKKQSNLLTTAT